MKSWQPGNFAKNNEINSKQKVVQQAVQGLAKLANTFERMFTVENTGNAKAKSGGKGSKGGKGKGKAASSSAKQVPKTQPTPEGC